MNGLHRSWSWIHFTEVRTIITGHIDGFSFTVFLNRLSIILLNCHSTNITFGGLLVPLVPFCIPIFSFSYYKIIFVVNQEKSI